MIEAVKSTVASSAVMRAGIDQNSTQNSYGANPTRIQQIAQAPFVSPTVRVDVTTKMAILEFRESGTGDVVTQIPSESQIRAYKLREAKEDAQAIAALTESRKSSSSASANANAPAPKDNPVIMTATDYANSDALLSSPTEVTV